VSAARYPARMRFGVLLPSLLSFAALAAGIVSCSDSEPSHGNGVNDVRKACDVQQTWSRGATLDCRACISAAAQPVCECNKDPALARCVAQANARGAEPDCTQTVNDCVILCPAGDCACTDACYAANAKCRAASSALLGCTTDVCDPRCR
jgi:hypothetical protein